MRILVVDDECTLRDYLVRMLKGAGYEVIPAACPSQALDIVKSHTPVHIVISDIQMPEMEGTQLIREVTRLSPKTACVLITGGLHNPPDVPDGVPVLKKPFLAKDLISVVEAVLAWSWPTLRDRSGS